MVSLGCATLARRGSRVAFITLLAYDARVRDLAALAVFEAPRPQSGAKFGAIKTLLELGVHVEGLRRLVDRAPWSDENKAKWQAQIGKIAVKTVVCPFCAAGEHETDCPVAKYLASVEARMTEMEIALLD